MERRHQIPAHLLSAIASAESGRYHPGLKLAVPWPWTINAAGKGHWFNSKEEAIAAVKRYQAKGVKSIDVGCMQVNLMYHGDAFANLSQAFEPAYNVAYAAKFLRGNYDKLKSWTKATAAYHSMTPSRGANYFRTVYKRWQQVVARLKALPESSRQGHHSYAMAEASLPPAASSIAALAFKSPYDRDPYRRNAGRQGRTTLRQPVRMRSIRVEDAATGVSRSSDFGELAYADDAALSGSGKIRPTTSMDERMQKGVLVIRANQRFNPPAPAVELGVPAAARSGGASAAAPTEKNAAKKLTETQKAERPGPKAVSTTVKNLAARGQFSPQAFVDAVGSSSAPRADEPFAAAGASEVKAPPASGPKTARLIF